MVFPVFGYPVSWFWPKPGSGPDATRKRDATVKCLEKIQQNVTVEYYFEHWNPEDWYELQFPKPGQKYTVDQRHRYRIYIDMPAVPGKQGNPFRDWSPIDKMVDRCFRGDKHLRGHTEMYLKSKESFLAMDPWGDYSMETIHVCGDPKQTALVGRDNTYIPDYCDCCDHEFLNSDREDL